MELKEGRCPNCGSILFLDPDQEKGHCLYCDCVFDGQEAFDIDERLAEGEDIVFPNEEQEPYTGPNLDPKNQVRDLDFEKIAARAEVQSSASKVGKQQQVYEIKKKQVTVTDLTLRQRIILTVIPLALFGIFLAFTIPATIERDKKKTVITENFMAAAQKVVPKSENLEYGKNVVIHGMSNQRLIMTLQEPIKEDQARALYKCFVEAYQDGDQVVSGKAPEADSASLRLWMRLAQSDGDYFLEEKAKKDGSGPELTVTKEE